MAWQQGARRLRGALCLLQVTRCCGQSLLGGAGALMIRNLPARESTARSGAVVAFHIVGVPLSAAVGPSSAALGKNQRNAGVVSEIRLALVTTAAGAHDKIPAGRGAQFVDPAAHALVIQRDAPAVFALAHYFGAVLVQLHQGARYAVLRQYHHSQPTTDGVAVGALDTRVDTFVVVLSGGEHLHSCSSCGQAADHSDSNEGPRHSTAFLDRASTIGLHPRRRVCLELTGEHLPIVGHPRPCRTDCNRGVLIAVRSVRSVVGKFGFVLVRVQLPQVQVHCSVRSRIAPAVLGVNELVRGRRAPRAHCIELDGRVLDQHGLNHGPRCFDGVFMGEQRAVAFDGVG